ncbi:MAG: bifunctional diaminohydroxyphosphoribosylaminopyrimidine deaminase/5-amino-6-(5-phosphoribosylamino)uracil reductase RibD, partial [Phascolarctobacterium sp.]|nr:bifunctional diaminohydroxyphosphoribosylaminopyrimidine deaminase/5-amino-6-(5-phosphoribosylamino)uracil reductase RibD [Candidatus Phascolarctobacterium caballi]
AGVMVEVGLCHEEAERLNEHFLFAVTHNRPFVSLKYAMTLDGKIATASGDSEWITNETSRKEAHYLRKTHDCILVGIGTVLADNPELTTRLVKGKNPVRVVLDSHLRLPLTSAVLNNGAKTIIFVNGNYDKNKFEVLQKLEHVEIAEAKNLQQVLSFLHEREYRSVLVEGGSQIHGAFLDAGLVNRVYAFVAPKLCGGQTSLSAIGGKGITLMNDALQLENLETKYLDGDMLLTAKVKSTSPKDE